jgi:hypothetical protein
MSTQFGKLCSLVLLEHFGEIVQKVGNDLYKCQPKALRLIAGSTKLPLKKVLNTADQLVTTLQSNIPTFTYIDTK